MFFRVNGPCPESGTSPAPTTKESETYVVLESTGPVDFAALAALAA
ncbi:hypothetical protein SAMN05216276_103554 [Streptosporangium subroseum]|uniref:Uncharacterized protein n=1 Tax=Streptosporangium subroseum TaxID=106412 RepID=A0A239LV01_9ACTN|nr:hypothetical protein [Streptosporangium subroseum]SNT34195.1 hypothetical protein SAMN05216276_103554 [Streptosporangium subroseum]